MAEEWNNGTILYVYVALSTNGHLVLRGLCSGVVKDLLELVRGLGCLSLDCDGDIVLIRME